MHGGHCMIRWKMKKWPSRSPCKQYFFPPMHVARKWQGHCNASPTPLCIDCFSILIVSFGHYSIVWFLLFIGSFKQSKIPSLLALKILILHFSSQNAPLCLKMWLHFDIVAIEHTLVVLFFNPAAFIISWRVLILSQKISALWHHLRLTITHGLNVI